MTRKTAFFEEWSWFKFNNLGLAYTSVAKGLTLNVRKFGGLNPWVISSKNVSLTKSCKIKVISIFFFSFTYSKKSITPSAALHLCQPTNIKFNVYTCDFTPQKPFIQDYILHIQNTSDVYGDVYTTFPEEIFYQRNTFLQTELKVELQINF